jgi:capsular exopolysaccharide synthesis family protein
MAVKKPEHKMHLVDYLWILKKRVLLILFFWVAVFTVVAAMTFQAEPLYRASAMMSIERSMEQPVLQGIMQTTAPEEWYNSQFEMLRSRRIARKLYDDMRMYDWEMFRRIGPERDHISIVRNWIRVTPIPKTHDAEVWIIWPDAGRAADMVNRVTDAYKEIVEESKTTNVARSVSVLVERVADIQRKVAETNNAIRAFSTERGVYYTLPEVRSVVLTREKWLEEATARANVDAIKAQSLYEAINKQVESGEFLGVQDDELLWRLRERRYGLEEMKTADRQGYSPRYLNQDTSSRTLQARIEEVDRQIAIENDRVQRTAISKVAQEWATARTNYDVLSEMLKTNREALNTISQDLLKLEGMRKEQENQDLIRTALNSAVESVRTQSEYQQAFARVVSKADEPKEKYSPNYPLNLGLGLAVGLMVGIGAAFFFEYLNTTIRMPRDIEEGLGLPVLGFVPAMSPRLKDFATRSLITHLDPGSGPAEAFRGIRTEVMLRSDLRQVKTGMVTSTSPQEGKTTVAINWAIALAQAGNKVLLIDGDLRKPMVHQAFHLGADRGLSTLLAEKDSATVYIKKTDIENLHVLPGGPIPQNPAELLGSRKMRTLVAEAAERYDSVIIDASPVLGVADASVLSTMVDCVVLVVQASKNRRALVLRAKNQLASVNARVAGAILNNVRGSRGDFYYYRQYYRPTAEIMEAEKQ